MTLRGILGRGFVAPLALVLCALLLVACSASTTAPAAPTAAPAKAAAPAEKYPTRPIDFIVPWGAGGGADQMARKIGSLAEKELGVALPAINVGGATGGTGAAKLLAAPADGYSILVYIADSHANVASGGAAYSFKDFAPVVRTQLCPSFFFVKSDSPYATWADLEKYAKANPGKLRVAITGEGSLDEITAAYFASKGIKMTAVPYPNPGERYAAVLGGHAEVLYEQAGDVRQYIANNQLKPLIIFSQQKLGAFPDVPASKELGYEIYLPQFRTIVAKKGTDDAKVQVLANAFKKATEAPEWAAFAKDQFMTADSFMGPAELTRFLEGEYDTMVTLMKQLGLKVK